MGDVGAPLVQVRQGGVNNGLSNSKQKSTIKSLSSARVAGLEAGGGDGGARRPGPVRTLPQHCQ